MRRSTRLISILLALIMLLDYGAALADDSHILTNEELKAAWALCGLDENAAPYHDGMAFSPDMNAQQIKQWLDKLLNTKISSLKSLHSEIENKLDDMKREEPGQYMMLTRGSNGGYYDTVMQTYRDTEELRQLLRFYRDRLDIKSGIIEAMKNQLTEGDVTRSQALSASREIEDAVEVIREIRELIAENQTKWQQDLETYSASLRGGNANAMEDDGLNGWLNNVRRWNQKEAVKETVSASALYPGGSSQSVLGRLFSAGSALADSSETVDVTVMNKDDIAFEVLDENGDPIVDATVYVTSADGKVSRTEKTNTAGTVLMKANDFDADEYDDINLTVGVNAEGTQGYVGHGIQMQKGDKQTVYQVGEKKEPYIISASFSCLGDHDILKNQYTAIYSKKNDDKFEIKAVMNTPSKMTLLYTDASGSPQTEEAEAQEEVTLEDGTKGYQAVFTNTWKKLIQPNSKIQIQYEGGTPTDLNLTLVKGIADIPVTDFMGNFSTGTFAGLTFKFPGDIKFLGDLSINLRIPWEDILAEKLGFSVSMLFNVDGSYGFFIGAENDDSIFPKIYDKTTKKVKENWKLFDSKDLANQMQEGENTYQQKLARIQNLYGNRTGFVKLKLFDCDFEIGGFYCFMALYRTDKGYHANLDDYTAQCRMQIGITVTFSAQMKFVFLVTPVMVYLGIGIDISFQAGFTLEVTIEKQNGHERWIWLQSQTGLTIVIRVVLTISLNADLLAVQFSLGGYGYLQFVCNIYFRSENTVYKALFAGFGVFIQVSVIGYVVARVAWDYKDPATGGPIQLWPKNSSSAGYSGNKLPWYAGILSIARADEPEEKTEETGERVDPQDYPALVPAASVQPALKDLSLDNHCIRYVDINNMAYAFYITGGKLTWTNLATGKTGNLSGLIKDWDPAYENLTDYAFDVRSCPLPQTWIDHSEVSRAGNAAYYRGKDLVMIGLLSTSELQEEKIEQDGQISTWKKPKNTSFSYCGLLHDPENDEFISVLPGNFVAGYNDQGFPIYADEWRILTYRELDWVAMDVQLSLHAPDSVDTIALLQDSMGTGDPVNHCAIYFMEAYYDYVEEYEEKTSNAYLNCTEQDLPSELKGAQQVKVRDKLITKFMNSANTRYYLSEGGQKDETSLMRYENESTNTVIASGDIAFYDVLWDENQENKADVFYLTEESRPAEDGAEQEVVNYHIKAVHEEFTKSPDPANGSAHALTLTNVDLDVTVPVSSFSVQRVEDTVYVYWLELAGGDADSPTDQSTYRLRGLVYDPDTQLSTDDFVMAQFAPFSTDEAPTDVFLSSDGMAYYTVRKNGGQGNGSFIATVYSFLHGLKPHADMRRFSPSDYLIMAGTDTDMYITVTNDGSANIEMIDLEVVLTDDDGNIIKDDDGKDRVIETLHADLLKPEQSTRDVTGDAESHTTGEHAIYRLEEAPDDRQQSRFNVEKTTKYYKVYETFKNRYSVSDPVTTAVEAKALLPGQTTVLKASVHIPADWEGLYHVTMRLADKQGNGLQDYGDDSEKADHSLHDIDVNHRIYRGPGGENYLHINIRNHAENGKPLRLYAEMYLDGDPTPVYVDLPYYSEYTSVGMAHNIDMPLSALMNGRKANVAYVTIRAVNEKEYGEHNNTFIIYLPDEMSIPLRITANPADVTVMEGENAEFYVAAAGGREPYSYLWQEYMGSELGWRDIPGVTESVLNVKNATKAMNGRQYRCRVTDHALATVVSEPAKLTVITRVPATGDNANLPLYLSLAAAAVFLAVLARILRKKKEQEDT